MPDIIVEGHHVRAIAARYGSKWPNGFRGEKLYRKVYGDGHKVMV